MTRRPSLRRRRAADPVPDAEPTTTSQPAATPDASAPAATPPASGIPVASPTPARRSLFTSAAPAPGDSAEPGGLPLPPAETAVHTPAPAPDPSAPAGLESQPAEPPVPSFRNRGRLRRRLRYLRRVRELGFRDLGGLVFDLHRFGRDGDALVAGKLEALASVDGELRTLEDAIDDRRDYVVLREPGIAACPRCAALHGSEANFCPNCGLRLDGPQAMSEVGDAPAGAASGPLPDSAATRPAGSPAPPVPRPDRTASAAPDPPAGDPAERDDAGSVRAADAGTTPVSSGFGPLGTEPPGARPDEDGEPPAPATLSWDPEPGSEPGRSSPAP